MTKKRGRPVIHLPIIDKDTGKIYRTYTDAAIDIGGDRANVYRVAIGIQTHHKGHTFEYIENELRARGKQGV